MDVIGVAGFVFRRSPNDAFELLLSELRQAEIVLDRENSDFGWFDADVAETRLPLEAQRRALQEIRGGFLIRVVSR
jgi:hypothetical protein